MNYDDLFHVHGDQVTMELGLLRVLCHLPAIDKVIERAQSLRSAIVSPPPTTPEDLVKLPDGREVPNWLLSRVADFDAAMQQLQELRERCQPQIAVARKIPVKLQGPN